MCFYSSFALPAVALMLEARPNSAIIYHFTFNAESNENIHYKWQRHI